MPNLFQNGKKICEITNLAKTPGQIKMIRAGNEVIPGRKGVDKVTFDCPEPFLIESTYEIHLDDGTIYHLMIERVTGTNRGSTVLAIITK